MARLARAEVFDPSEVAVLHIWQGWYVAAFCSAPIRLLGKTTITEKFGSKINSNSLPQTLGLTYLRSRYSQTIST